MIDRRVFLGAAASTGLFAASQTSDFLVKGSRVEMADVDAPEPGSVVLLSEAWREGIFVFRRGDFSQHVAKDPLQGVFIPLSSDQRARAGCWVRTFDGAVMVDWFGAAGDGVSDDSAAIAGAIRLASSLADNTALANWSSLAFKDVGFRGGAVYHLGRPVTIGHATARFHLVGVGGHACLVGNAERTHKGFVFSSLRSTVFKRLNFSGFSTATQWDTDNTDTSHIKYVDCEWSDCEVGVDTVSYGASRSTVLVFDRCRTGDGVKRWVESFCDMLTFNDVHVRSGSGNQAFVRADSQVIVRGGIWTPYVDSVSANPSEGARWFDIHDESSHSTARRAIASRSLTVEGAARFGPENGGYPIVCSYLRGDTTKSRRLGPHISIGPGVFAACTGRRTPRQLVILMDAETSGVTKTSAPNTIRFDASAWRAANGAIGTESGKPLGVGNTNFVRGQVNLDFAPGSVRTLGTLVASTRYPLVQRELEGFVTDWHGLLRI